MHVLYRGDGALPSTSARSPHSLQASWSHPPLLKTSSALRLRCGSQTPAVNLISNDHLVHAMYRILWSHKVPSKRFQHDRLWPLQSRATRERRLIISFSPPGCSSSSAPSFYLSRLDQGTRCYGAQEPPYSWPPTPSTPKAEPSATPPQHTKFVSSPRTNPHRCISSTSGPPASNPTTGDPTPEGLGTSSASFGSCRRPRQHKQPAPPPPPPAPFSPSLSSRADSYRLLRGLSGRVRVVAASASAPVADTDTPRWRERRPRPRRRIRPAGSA